MHLISPYPNAHAGPSKVCDTAEGCRIDDGYDLQIKCLRTGAVHGLRMVFVDGVPQVFPLLENLRGAPTSYRSLSRRESRVLQMIARGMSNKCIARSLGIAPETVKTHVKGILSKLKARVASAEILPREESGISPTALPAETFDH